jgi:hypothetical protein
MGDGLMSRKNNATLTVPIPDGEFAQVYAVTVYRDICCSDDCDGHYDEGTSVVELFLSKQTAEQFADKRNEGREHGPYRVVPMRVHSSFKNVY